MITAIKNSRQPQPVSPIGSTQGLNQPRPVKPLPQPLKEPRLVKS